MSPSRPRIFVDTNVLLDVLLERHPHCEPAQHVWTLADTGQLRAAIAATSLTNIFFIIQKLAGREKAYWAVETLQQLFTIIGVTPIILKKALAHRFPDFEDAVQYGCARAFRAAAILSRDRDGFKKSSIPVLDCHQYLAQLGINKG